MAGKGKRGAAKRFTQNQGNSAIAYYRYSSDAQRDASIDQQREAAQQYAAAHGLHIVREYEDHAISGTRDDREQYNLMLYEVEILRPAALIIWKTDRLSRDKIDIALAKKRLRECGVKIVYVAEAIPDNDDATQVLLESIYEGMAAAFIESHRKNVTRGLTYNAERGLYNGIRMLGYRGEPDKPYEIDPDTAPIVQRIYKEYADGTPMMQICRDLDAQGIKSIHGNAMTVNSLRRILTNRAYIGEYSYSGHVIPDGMPRIIDDDLFAKVQARLEANKRGGKGARRKIDQEADIADYWLSGHIYCGLCGETMQGISGTGKSGKRHYYYSCKGHRQHQCAARNRPKDVIEAAVTYVLDQIVRDPTYRIDLAHKCYELYKEQHDDGGVYIDAIRAKIKEAETKISNIMRAIEDGILTETTGERLKVLEAEKARLTDALQAEELRRNIQLTEADILKYLDSLGGDVRNPEDRARILGEYVDRVIVTDDEVAVIMQYTPDRRVVSITDTLRTLAQQREILGMLDGSAAGNAPEKLRQSVIGTDEDDPDFFA